MTGYVGLGIKKRQSRADGFDLGTSYGLKGAEANAPFCHVLSRDTDDYLP